MANRLPRPDEYLHAKPERIVLPNRPFELHFVLIPAVTLDVQLLDTEGKSMANRSVWINGRELPPSSSVLDSGETDDDGRIRFSYVAPGYAWRLTYRDDTRRDVRSLPITFAKSGEYQVKLRLRQDGLSEVDFLEILSVTDSAGVEVRDQVVGDDPLMRPPVAAELQERGRTILAKLREVNRYWLDRPPPEVHSYRYEFKYGDDKSTTFVVPEDGKVSRFVRNGISYDSALHYLTAEPANAVFRLVEEGPETIRLAYTLSRPIRMSAGNGVEGAWRGYFTTMVREGLLVIDSKTLTPREHTSAELRETWTEHVEIRPACYAPLAVAIRGGHHYDWTFRVYEPGLWLLAAARRPGETDANAAIATVENVTVNGRPTKTGTGMRQ
jgi:hypothetical protein